MDQHNSRSGFLDRVPRLRNVPESFAAKRASGVTQEHQQHRRGRGQVNQLFSALRRGTFESLKEILKILSVHRF